MACLVVVNDRMVGFWREREKLGLKVVLAEGSFEQMVQLAKHAAPDNDVIVFDYPANLIGGVSPLLKEIRRLVPDAMLLWVEEQVPGRFQDVMESVADKERVIVVSRDLAADFSADPSLWS